MKRDEALLAAWSEILSGAESVWEDDTNESGHYTEDDWEKVNKAIWDILERPDRYGAYLPPRRGVWQ